LYLATPFKIEFFKWLVKVIDDRKGQNSVEILNNNMDIVDSQTYISNGADETVTGILSGFETLSAEDINMSGFRKRYIAKYIIPVNLLHELINDCRENYKLLERFGNHQSDVFLEYFDTAGLKFFNDHVNGKLNRIKVRVRSCRITGDQVWEIWRRKSKGRMVKKSVPVNGNLAEFEEKAAELVSNYTGTDLHTLTPSLLSSFRRITLLNPEGLEKITIDTNICFASPEHPELPKPVDGLVIIELRKRKKAVSFLANMLAKHKVRPVKISKYCLGISLTNKSAKTNNYKPVIRNIEKNI
jgi:hypothetical protein